MPSDVRIPGEVAAALGYYVYALRDPRDGKVFYVGKGIGDRINAHVREAGADPASERAKLRTINEIEATGRDVDLLFLRTGIEDEDTAFTVEQAVIDAFGASGHALTNLVRGHYSGRYGLASLPAMVARYRAEPCPPIPHAVIMLKIQNGWRPDMNEQDVYDRTRGHWKIAGWVRDEAQYALGVAYDIVRGAYRLDSWFPSEMPWDEGKNRWGFVGTPAPELAHLIGTHVRDAFPNQVMYRRYLEGYPGSTVDDRNTSTPPVPEVAPASDIVQQEFDSRGNQSAIAKRLGISRQAVAKLIKNRERTGIPTPGGDGLFDLDDVADWYVNDFEPTSGPTRGIRTKRPVD